MIVGREKFVEKAVGQRLDLGDNALMRRAQWHHAGQVRSAGGHDGDIGRQV
jgi:hypothetical protein